MGTGNMCRVPPATVHPGRARQWSGTGPCGYCTRVLWVPGHRGQYSGNTCFNEKHGVQDEGGRHVAKRSSDLPVAYPEVNVQVRDLVHVRTVERTHDRTSQKQYTRYLILPSWRHETWSGLLCEGIIHILRIELYAKGALCGPVSTHRAPIGALREGSSMRIYRALCGSTELYAALQSINSSLLK